ncbi:36025_t:CDS:2, partial [Racocetra persica]
VALAIHPPLMETLGGGIMVATTTITVPGQVVVGAVAAAGLVVAGNVIGDQPANNLVNSAGSSSSVPATTVPAGCSTASQAASSVVTTCFERKTISDWLLTDVVTNEESQRLLALGFDRTTCFGLPELKEHLDFDSPGQPTSKVGFEPPKNWDVPTGENPSNPNAHGGPHWDVENPRTGEHVDVFPDGKVTEADLRELLALFYRYGVDMKQLAVFL